jgi:hypothetical protein
MLTCKYYFEKATDKEIIASASYSNKNLHTLGSCDRAS